MSQCRSSSTDFIPGKEGSLYDSFHGGEGRDGSQATGTSDYFCADDENLDLQELWQCLDELDNGFPAAPAWRPIQDEPQLLRPPHCKREAVVCVVPLRTASTFSYAVISRLGRVGVYDANLKLLDSYTIALGFTPPKAKIGIGREGDQREPRQRNTWVNDAIFLQDAQVLVVAASDRSVTVLDASRLLHSRRCDVHSLPNAPRCLSYAPGSLPGAPSRLFIGDDAGGVTTLTFKKPRQALFRPPDAENKSTSCFWTEVLQQSEWVSVGHQPRVHKDAVCRMAYCAHNDTLASCSRDPVTTLTIRHLAGRRVPYVFSMPQGASCFVLERGLEPGRQVLVTGSRETLVRLWNPLVPAQPLACLSGHRDVILDVLVVCGGELVLSLDKRGVLRVWRLSEQACVQAYGLPFTCLDVPGHKIEFGSRALYSGPPTRDEGAEMVVLAALGAELVLVRVCPPPDVKEVCQDDPGGSRPLAPPRRDQSPAVPGSWAPSLLEMSCSASGSFPETPREELGDFTLDHRQAEAVADFQSQGETQEKDSSERSQTDLRSSLTAVEDERLREMCRTPDSVDELPFPKPQPLLTESIADWPVPDDAGSYTPEEAPSQIPPSSPKSVGQPSQPASHRPVQDENGLYPEEIASLRALGLQPLDLESLGVGLNTPTNKEEEGRGNHPPSILPTDTLAAVRQAQAKNKRSYKQMRTLAWHCAPHLALHLPQEIPLHFSKPLPVTSRMRARGLDLSDPEKLMKAKLPRQAGRQKLMQQHSSGSITSSTRLGSGRESGSSSINL